MFKAPVNPYDEIVAKATDENQTSENWEVIITLCDKVQEEGETGARNVVAAILKRLAHRTSNVQLYALSLAEALSKNCTIELHRELASRSFTQGLEKLVGDRNTHEKVKRRALSLVRTWAAEFESDPTLGIMGECYENLRAKHSKLDQVIEPPPPEVDDEIRRKEEEELQRVLELSMQDKGGRSNWVSKYPDQGASSSSAASTSQAARSKLASSSKPSVYPSGYSPSPNAALSVQSAPSSTIYASVPNETSLPNYPQTSAAPQSSSVVATPASAPISASVPAPAPAPTLPVSPSSPVQISRVRALHTFEPTEPGELGFEKGDVIKVVDRGYKDWWRGQLRGKTGIFPVNYVEPIPEPTPAEIAQEAQQEAQIFAQAAAIDQLLEMLRKVDPLKDNLADNEEIQELYRSSMTLRPKIVKLIDRYSQKRADLVAMNESFVKARRIFDQVMEESLAKHNPGAALYDYTRIPEPRPDSRAHPAAGYPASPAYGWNANAYGNQQQGIPQQYSTFEGPHPVNYGSQELQQQFTHAYGAPPQVSPTSYAAGDPAVYQIQLQQQQFQQMQQQQIPPQNPQTRHSPHQPVQQQQQPSPGYPAPTEQPQQQQVYARTGAGYRPPAASAPAQSGFVEPVQSPQPQQSAPSPSQTLPHGQSQQSQPHGQPLGQPQTQLQGQPPSHPQQVQLQGEPLGQPHQAQPQGQSQQAQHQSQPLGQPQQAQVHVQPVQKSNSNEQVPSQAHVRQQSLPAQALPNPQVVGPLPVIDGPPPYPFDISRQYADPNVQAWVSYYASGGNDPAGRMYFIPTTLPPSAVLSIGDTVQTHRQTGSQSQQSQTGSHNGAQSQQLEHEPQPGDNVPQAYAYGGASRPVAQQDPARSISPSVLAQMGVPPQFRRSVGRSELPQGPVQGYQSPSIRPSNGQQQQSLQQLPQQLQPMPQYTQSGYSNLTVPTRSASFAQHKSPAPDGVLNQPFRRLSIAGPVRGAPGQQPNGMA